MKRLVLCCDGTWNSADQERNGVPAPTNVVKLAYRVAKRDGATLQVIYYDQGVGTGNFFDRLTGGAFGDGVEANICDAYRFLIGNYDPGDEIYLFGFSRGAYTVRSIGGMIRKCGILARPCVKHYHAAIELYRDGRHPDQPGPAKFRRDYSISGAEPIPVRMIGAWDTVGALGIPLRGFRGLTHARYQFHDTELSDIVQYACHALAIDEHRAPFAPTLWTHQAKTGQQVEQVWFCGAHGDIGGGHAESGLSDITLDWMLGKAAQRGARVRQPGPGGLPAARQSARAIARLEDRALPADGRHRPGDRRRSHAVAAPVGEAALGRRRLVSPGVAAQLLRADIASPQPSARQTSEPPEASSISDTARSRVSREIFRNSRRATLMPKSAAGTTASAARHTSGSSSSPVRRNAAARSEMLVSVAKPMVARNCSLVSPRCER